MLRINNRYLLRFAGAMLLAGGAVAVAGSWITTPKAQAQPMPGYGPVDYAAARRAVDNRLALSSERVGRHPESWAFQESLASGYLAQARLTGSYRDYARAGKALAIGRANAPAGAGPQLASAVYGIATHDLALAAKSAQAVEHFAVPALAGDAAEAKSIQADVAFYTGHYGQAIKGYQAARAIQPLTGIAFRIAQWQRKMGEATAARKTIMDAVVANRSRTPEFMGIAQLALGGMALEKGDWDQADKDFARADKLFPGYWLTQAHLAQMAAARGQYAEAERRYLSILKTTPEPLVMDALAALYRAQAKVEPMRKWADRAGRIWNQRLSVLPLAARGHAIEHELAFGDPKTALSLAQADYRARPYGDPATFLASAEMANGNVRKAIQLLTGLEQSGWRTAQSRALLSQAYALNGQAKLAEAKRAEALSLNPHAFDSSLGLIWFGHH